jgi:hypothetical protein
LNYYEFFSAKPAKTDRGEFQIRCSANEQGRVQELFGYSANSERRIEGFASTSTVNSHGYSLNPRGCHISLPVPLWFSHARAANGQTRRVSSARGESVAIGTVYYARTSTEGIWVKAIVDDSIAGDHAWRLIESGEVRCFSGAAAPSSLRVKGIVDGVTYYDAWTLSEVSVCPKGANPDCWFYVC